MDDNTQLGQFAETGSQEAFQELVGRHTDLVYACAMQRLHDAHAAQDVTQAVFLTLALKAKDLRSHTSLAGWLFTTTRYVAARYQRGEQRRKEREMRAFEESQIADTGTAEAAWEELEPHLAGALDSLSGADREAVLLRFYRKASHQEVAAALGTSEDGARKRVDRALEKLRRFFTKKGMALSATALIGALTANAAQAAPAGLAITASATALAGVSGTLATTSTLALAKGAIHMMLVAQVKTVTAVAAACVVVAGGGVIVAKEVLTPSAPTPVQVCCAQARTIHQACINYAGPQNSGQFPKSFKDLLGSGPYSAFLKDKLICPAAPDQTNTSYELLWTGDWSARNGPKIVAIREINANHEGRRVVCFLDGHVEIMADRTTNTESAGVAASQLNVVSVPSDARVLINDVYQGVAPVTYMASSGTYRVSVELEGYERALRNVRVAQASRTVEEFRLVRKVATQEAAAQARYTIGDKMLTEAEKLFPPKTPEDRKKVGLLLAGGRDDNGKYNSGALQHFLNIFYRYPSSPWASQSGQKAKRAQSMLEEIGAKVSVSVTDEQLGAVGKGAVPGSPVSLQPAAIQGGGGDLPASTGDRPGD